MKLNSQINISADILFSKPQDENINFPESDLIELFPYGLSLSNDAARPFIILRDKTNELSLPVPINQLEAGVALSLSAQALPPVSIHSFSQRLLESLDIKLTRCLFVEIKGVHQYVRLYMDGHPQYQSLKFRADEILSLCFHQKVPMFATRDFINRSKVMSAEIAGLAQGIQNNPGTMIKTHNYLM